MRRSSEPTGHPGRHEDPRSAGVTRVADPLKAGTVDDVVVEGSAIGGATVVVTTLEPGSASGAAGVLEQAQSRTNTSTRTPCRAVGAVPTTS